MEADPNDSRATTHARTHATVSHLEQSANTSSQAFIKHNYSSRHPSIEKVCVGGLTSVDRFEAICSRCQRDIMIFSD